MKHTTNDTTPSITPNQLPQPTTATITSAHYKQRAADFIVNEILTIDFSGNGEHLWLFIEKQGMNTLFVINALAKWANIPRRDIGYSGLKDRHAITRQWFSLRLPTQNLPDTTFFLEDTEQQEYAKVIETHWHHKKLNRGTHKANEFIITLRDVAGDMDAIDAQLQQLADMGIPNYFGEQRFGRDGDNIQQALEWLENGTIHGRKPHPKKSRDMQSLLLSSARSLIFNEILAARVQNKTWNTGMDGDVFNLDGTGSVFASEMLDATLTQRLITGDIHPTGVMWGVKNDKIQGSAKELEIQTVQNNELLSRLATAIEKQGIKSSRRPLRLSIHNLTWHWITEQTENKPSLKLYFCLPTGSYATSVLSALIQPEKLS
ncbi:tRNA pseudouridine(13) synthase TruD [Psychrobacter sp. I-STPA6b]|uniref:tRNA pseudouridine(13) synthase TruD n=1 Tax=Psychrobacter sp. I-STPA6b TaxID=2585718 RepID=UPI001D0C7034|nr:tRNA pseudouridine(13) synthase TruD [Psychrobacter sp. I-STPA6b]